VDARTAWRPYRRLVARREFRGRLMAREKPVGTAGRVPAMILTDGLRSLGAGVRLWFSPARIRAEGTTPDYRFLARQ